MGIFWKQKKKGDGLIETVACHFAKTKPHPHHFPQHISVLLWFWSLLCSVFPLPQCSLIFPRDSSERAPAAGGIFEQGLANRDIPVLLACQQCQGETPTHPAVQGIIWWGRLLFCAKIKYDPLWIFLGSIPRSSGLKINKAEHTLHYTLIMCKQESEQGARPRPILL